MAATFTIQHTVPFHDLDPLQVVWHGNYLKYFDMARFALFDNAGVDLYRYMTANQYVFPITRSSIKHIAPLKFNDRFTCKATATEARYKIALDFEIRLSGENTLCARGSSEQVSVKLPNMELEFEIPPNITKALGF